MCDMKYLCVFENKGDGKIDIREVSNFVNMNKFEKQFVDYCENKECNRVCPLEVNINCLMNFLFSNYLLIPKGEVNNE